VRQKTRMIAASMVAAVALGIAAPAASAVEANRTAVTATSLAAAVTSTPQAEVFPQVELSTESAARAEGERAARGGKLSALKELLKKSPALFKAAVKAAKKGAAAFERWVNSLSNFNPVKWAIKATPGVIISELIAWLAQQVI
jgi:hypothetical protein